MYVLAVPYTCTCACAIIDLQREIEAVRSLLLVVQNRYDRSCSSLSQLLPVPNSDFLVGDWIIISWVPGRGFLYKGTTRPLPFALRKSVFHLIQH